MCIDLQHASRLGLDNMKFEKKKPQKKPKSYEGFSEEYPMFAFRVPKTEGSQARLERIKGNLEAIYDRLKAQRKPDQKVINRNDILFEALDKGLIQVKKDVSS